jgi:hypothetical protein
MKDLPKETGDAGRTCTEIKDFEKWYKKINASDEDDYLEFVRELMKTPFTEYHYSLMTNKNTNSKFKNNLWHL